MNENGMKASFDVVYVSGDTFVIIPLNDWELIQSDDKSVILRRKTQKED